MEPISFGKYLLLERIAAGGMAEVFRARFTPAPGVEKIVVIKRILPHYAQSARFVEMFTNEARIAMGLSHGNIAQVFDFGREDGDYFLAMEWVDGPTLSALSIRSRNAGYPGVPIPLSVVMTADVLAGLHYAHTRQDEKGRPLGIIHRDVSPQNVLVGYEGQVKIVDFGIAKARHATTAPTAAGSFKGKIAYFAPEQARNEPLDARTDVFATGVMLYELLCGTLPFPGKPMEAIGRLLEGDFSRPRSHNPKIPRPLEEVMMTALAQDRDARFPSAASFERALRAFVTADAPGVSAETVGWFAQHIDEELLQKRGRHVELPATLFPMLAAWRVPGRPEPTVVAQPLRTRTESIPRAAAVRSPWSALGRGLAIAAAVGALATIGVFALPRLGEARAPPMPAAPPVATTGPVKLPGLSLHPPLTEATLPLEKMTFHVPASNAARTRLDPSRSVSVSVLAMDDDAGRPALTWLGFAEGAGDERHLMRLTSTPTALSGASALYVYTTGPHPAARVRVEDVDTHAVTELELAASRATALPEADERATVAPLSPAARYRLVLRASPAAPSTARGAAAVSDVIFCVTGANDTSDCQVLPLNESRSLTGATAAWLFVPDDSTWDNEGAFLLDLAVEPPPPDGQPRPEN